MSQSLCTSLPRVHRAATPSTLAAGSGLAAQYCGHACAAQDAGGCQQEFETSSRSEALFTEHEAPQLVAQLLHFFGIIRLTKAFRQLEEGLLLFLARLDSLLDKFHKDSIIAELALPRHGFHLFRDFSRQGNASPHLLCCCSFCCRRHTVINIHQCGALRKAGGPAWSLRRTAG